jgi:hypothetical protein
MTLVCTGEIQMAPPVIPEENEELNARLGNNRAWLRHFASELEEKTCKRLQSTREKQTAFT